MATESAGLHAAVSDTATNSTSTAHPITLAPIVRLLLTPAETAAALRISQRLLWARTKIGEIPCIRIGKCVRYDPRRLAEFLDRAGRVK